jgi:hypothetical protein
LCKISHINRESRYFSNWGYIKLDIFDIVSNKQELFSIDFNLLFECLKKKGLNNSVEELSIDYENWGEIEYGNYNLKKIPSLAQASRLCNYTLDRATTKIIK